MNQNRSCDFSREPSTHVREIARLEELEGDIILFLRAYFNCIGVDTYYLLCPPHKIFFSVWGVYQYRVGIAIVSPIQQPQPF